MRKGLVLNEKLVSGFAKKKIQIKGNNTAKSPGTRVNAMISVPAHHPKRQNSQNRP